MGIDVSKESLVTSKGRVRKYRNDREGYERIMEMRPEVVVLEPSGVYSVRPSQYFKERGVKVLQVGPNVLFREKDLRGKKTDFYDKKLEHMVDEAREYVHNPLRESVSLYLFLKDVEVKFRNRLRRALFLVSDDDGVSQERLERFSRGDFSELQLYRLEYTDSVLEEIRALSKVLLEVREELRRVQEKIEGMVPENHVLLTIPGVGKLAAGIILGVVEDIKRFPKPESFVAHCLDPVVERSGKATISKGISRRGDRHLRSLFYFLAQMNYSRNPTLLKFHESHRERLRGKKLYTALARKLARIVWSVWYNNKPYEPR